MNKYQHTGEQPSELPDLLKKEPTKILLVEDEENQRRQLQKAAQRRGWICDTASGKEEAKKIFSPTHHQGVITDRDMPDKEGDELVRYIKEQSPTTPVIMYTANPPTDTEKQTIGADKYITKKIAEHGIKTDEVLDTIEQIIKQKN